VDKEAREAIGEAIGLGLVAGWFVFWISNSVPAFWITVLAVAAVVWGSKSSQSSGPSANTARGAPAAKAAGGAPTPRATPTPKATPASRAKPSPGPSSTTANCPCACGRTVGRLQRGLIPRYQLIIKTQRSFAVAASRAIDSVADITAKREISRALENGERVRKDVLLHLHGLAAPGVALDSYHLKVALDAYFDWGFSVMRYVGIEVPPDWS